MRTRTLSLAVMLSCAAAAQASADAVGDWNQKAVTFGEARQMAPPQAERVMALVHLAMFDALNSIDRRYRPALVQLNSAVTASREAAAAAAAATVLAGLDPAKAAATHGRPGRLARGDPRRRGEIGGHPSRRGGGGQGAAGAHQRRQRSPRRLSAEGAAGRLCPDGGHRRLDVAGREAVCA